MKPSRVCTFCVMDESGPTLEFDARGECDCCRNARERARSEWFPTAEGERRLHTLTEQIAGESRRRPYDAIIGLSGGTDSAYLAHVLATRFRLRLLAIHVDGGWNTEPAVHNIERLVRALGLDLYTYVVEWQEMRDVQLAFLRASVLNQDIPQDHAFFTTLYRTAETFNVRHFLSGVNFASECISLPGWGYPNLDGRHIRGIHRRFGSRPLETFPVMDVTEYIWRTSVSRRLEIHRPLNFLDYDKEAARRELEREYGFKDYGSKHHESRFTRFYQEVYLPARYGFDKRRLHLSSQIVANHLSRDSALAALRVPACDANSARLQTAFVAKKLGVSPKELESLIALPAVPHDRYPGARRLIDVGVLAKSWARRARQRLVRAT